MTRYKFNGIYKVTYTYYVVDEVIEADDKEDAIDGLIETLELSDADGTDYDIYSLAVEEVEPESEAQRMSALGMPMLPGF